MATGSYHKRSVSKARFSDNRYTAHERKPTNASSCAGSAKHRIFGCFRRCRVAQDAPRRTRAVPKNGAEYAAQGSASKPG